MFSVRKSYYTKIVPNFNYITIIYIIVEVLYK